MSTMGQRLLRLTQAISSSLVDQAGETLGRVDDLVVRLGSGYPPVTGLRVRIGGRHVFVPISQVAEITPGRVRLMGEIVNLRRFERREGEVLLRQDILDHKVIQVAAGRLVHASDIALGRIGDAWRVAGIDVSAGTILQRVLRRSSTRTLDPTTMVDWARLEPFVGHVPTAKLHLPLHRLRGLHPAQLADLIEAASPEQGKEIVTAVRGDPELEADVVEELATAHQVRFLQGRSDSEAAAILGSMSPDDAADLIGELPQERRASVLARLPPPQQATVRGLLAYNPSTAGGLMTPDFVAVDQSSSVARVLERVMAAPFPVLAVYLTDPENHLIGSLSLHALLRARRDAHIGDAVKPVLARLRVDADFTAVALLMADYNLTEAPVVDVGDRLVGVIAVDDVLETLIPVQWHRREEGSIR